MKQSSQKCGNVGQLFVIGYRGETPADSFLDFIERENIGGVILFADNCPTHLVARQNIERIKARFTTFPPLIAIDQEGGRVCRLKGAPVEFKAASVYGQENSPDHFVEDYRRAAVYMEALGINLNLAPVADILLDPDSSCLKDRCFGDTPEQTARYVAASVMVARTAGILSCLKHFPGLGAARNDPHEHTSIADYDAAMWQKRERIPFAAGIEAGADLIMTTHVHLSNVDFRIATGSEKVVAGLIRQNLDFDGPVITDDLLMNGAATLGGIGERTVAAFRAGHDILLFGQDVEASMAAYRFFRQSVEGGEIESARIEASLERIAGIKIKLGRPVFR